VIYKPPELFNEHQIADQALNQCVGSTIAEQNLTKAEQLTRLICPTGDIRNLAGLEIFHRLEYLGIAGNRVEDVEVVSTLKNLKQADLSDNDIRVFTPLESLNKLTYLDLRGNANAICVSLTGLRGRVQVKIPKHC